MQEASLTAASGARARLLQPATHLPAWEGRDAEARCAAHGGPGALAMALGPGHVINQGSEKEPALDYPGEVYTQGVFAHSGPC